MNFEVEIKKIVSEIPYYIAEEFDKKLEEHSEIYIYGAGFMGMKYADLLEKKGFSVLGLFETRCTVANMLKNNLPITTVVLQDKPVIISSFKYFAEMKETLLQLGYKEKYIVSPFAVFEKFYLPRFKNAFSLFDDELSQKTIFDKIRYLVLEANMRPVSAYFDCEIFAKGNDEVYVDGGAFDGETAKEFAYAFNNRYKKIYCFEPTKTNYDITVENLKGFENVEVINKGLYSDITTLRFKDYGTDEWNAVEDFFMGHEWDGPAKEYKIIEVPVTTLDAVFKDKLKEDYPTIIKLDIEGSEREALMGMRTVINTSHPKLIICAYHKIEDYFELAETIQAICPGYCLQLRHYTDNVKESIIFGYFKE